MTIRSLQILCVLRCKRSLSSHFQSVTRALSYCNQSCNLKWVYDDVNHNNRLSQSRYVENVRAELWTSIHLVEHTTGPFEPIYIKYLSIKLAIYPRLNSAKKRQIRNWRHIIVCLNKTWMLSSLWFVSEVAWKWAYEVIFTGDDTGSRHYHSLLTSTFNHHRPHNLFNRHCLPPRMDAQHFQFFL